MKGLYPPPVIYPPSPTNQNGAPTTTICALLHAAYTSSHIAPPWALTLSLSAATRMAFRRERSTTKPPCELAYAHRRPSLRSEVAGFALWQTVQWGGCRRPPPGRKRTLAPVQKGGSCAVPCCTALAYTCGGTRRGGGELPFGFEGFDFHGDVACITIRMCFE